MNDWFATVSLSCIGAWDAGVGEKTLSPKPNILFWDGRWGCPSSGWLCPCCGSCWSFIFCSWWFHLPGSHWLAILQVWASYSSISRRLPNTKVYFPSFKLLLKIFKTLKSSNNFILLHVRTIVEVKGYLTRIVLSLSFLEKVQGVMSSCHVFHSIAWALIFHQPLFSVSLRMSQGNHLPLNPLSALLLIHLLHWLLQLQPAPWNQSMMCHTSGGPSLIILCILVICF